MRPSSCCERRDGSTSRRGRVSGAAQPEPRRHAAVHAAAPSAPARLGLPVVATSGNLSDEPICTDEREALERLGGIADLFLVHDRPIVRHVDDSIVRVMLGRELVLRRARGYAPLPDPAPAGGGAAGARRRRAPEEHRRRHRGSQRLHQPAHRRPRDRGSRRPRFERGRSRASNALTGWTPERRGRGPPSRLPARPGTRRRWDVPVVHVQHHFAHVAACMAENDLDGRVLGRGVGRHRVRPGRHDLGRRVSPGRRRRVRARGLPAAVPPAGRRARRPRAAPRRPSACCTRCSDATSQTPSDSRQCTRSTPHDAMAARQALEPAINSPITTSAGRLFDAVASLLDLRQQASFEGQAAMDLEFAADPA